MASFARHELRGPNPWAGPRELRPDRWGGVSNVQRGGAERGARPGVIITRARPLCWVRPLRRIKGGRGWATAEPSARELACPALPQGRAAGGKGLVGVGVGVGVWGSARGEGARRKRRRRRAQFMARAPPARDKLCRGRRSSRARPRRLRRGWGCRGWGRRGASGRGRAPGWGGRRAVQYLPIHRPFSRSSSHSSTCTRRGW
jgi:hypothetical protein